MRILVYLLAITIIAVLIFLWSGSVAHLSSLYRLSSNPATTRGVIIEKLPEERGGSVKYRFTVAFKNYESMGWIPEFEASKIGDNLDVRYDPSDPGVSMLSGNASDNFKSTLLLLSIFSFVGGLLFGIPLATLIVFKWMRRLH